MDEGDSRVAEALEELRDRLREPLFPLEVADAAFARRTCREIADQLDDYLLPRLASPDAPLLVVVGGSTGVGKSTLVNALAGRRVSPAGALRPTTRSPVLICAPDDGAWFADDKLLPSLPRSTEEVGPRDEGVLHVVTCDTLPAGLAVLDAPDFDSVVEPNRRLATQLLGAADLWLFVTTAARYADAVPWGFLIAARDRGVAVAVAVDRCPEASGKDATAHFAQLLEKHGLGGAPFFVVPEVTLEGEDLLPEAAVEPLRGWLTHVAGDEDARRSLVLDTFKRTIDSLTERLAPVTEVAERQDAAAAALRAAAADAYATARQGVDSALVDGSLVKGDVLNRWREFVDTGELMQSLTASSPEAAERVDALSTAVVESVRAVLLVHASQGAEDTVAAWRAVPAGRALLDGADEKPYVPSPDLADRAAHTARDWQQRVRERVHESSTDDGGTTASYDAKALGLILMLVAATPVGAATGAMAAVARSTTRASRRLLEAIFGGDAVRQHAAAVRRDLQGDLHELLESEAARFTGLLEHAGVPRDAADRLREVQFGLHASRRVTDPPAD
ncbi:MAG: dynamin family protein [Acidothermales bacterium]|nr:dynamin family protein [Acidothermales bacterium]